MGIEPTIFAILERCKWVKQKIIIVYPDANFHLLKHFVFLLYNRPVSNPIAIVTEFSYYYAILGVIIMLVGYLQNMLWNTAAERQIYKIRLRFYQAILRQETAWFDTHKAGELTSRVSEYVEWLSSLTIIQNINNNKYYSFYYTFLFFKKR